MTKTDARITFDLESPIPPQGLDNISLDQDVAVTLVGRVKELSRHSYEDTETGRISGSRTLELEVYHFRTGPVLTEEPEKPTPETLYPGMEGGVPPGPAGEEG